LLSPNHAERQAYKIEENHMKGMKSKLGHHNPKLNTGKEPFKCGMENAECGVRPNLIPVIAKHRAPSRRDPPAFI
jgi:hypothetical protein